MSECPNCGSAVHLDIDVLKTYVCGSTYYNDGDKHNDEACELIRSLREELAEARDAERDRIADHLELRASKLEDELAISETSTEIGLERILAVIKSLRKEAMALRDNEHRSDT